MLQRHDEFQLHRKLKQAAGIYKLKPANILRDDDGEKSSGLKILQSEVEAALKKAPTRKHQVQMA